MNAEIVDKYREHIGAQRVESWDYQEPFLNLKLVFKQDGREQEVSGILDLSDRTKIAARLQEMRKQAQRLIKERGYSGED